MRQSNRNAFGCILFLFLFVFPSAAESKTLTGTLYHRDVLMSNLTAALPEFWFYNGDTYEYPNLTTSYDPSDSTYEIFDCPESTNFLIDVSFPGEYGADPDLPKSYSQQIRIDTTAVNSQDIQLYYIIHLLTPYNNANAEFSTYPNSPYPIHYSPVLFSWEAVTGADNYDVTIGRYKDPDHPEGGYGHIETIALENTVNLTYLTDLLPSASFEHYEFSLTAYASNTLIGYYGTVYYNGNGRDYRFKVSDWPQDCASSITTEMDGYEIQNIPDDTGKIIIRAAFKNKNDAQQPLTFSQGSFQLQAYNQSEEGR